MVYPPKTNMTMENPPWMKMYFLLTMGFQCHVSFQGGNSPIFSNCIWRPLTPDFHQRGHDDPPSTQLKLPSWAAICRVTLSRFTPVSSIPRTVTTTVTTEVRCPHFLSWEVLKKGNPLLTASKPTGKSPTKHMIHVCHARFSQKIHVNPFTTKNKKLRDLWFSHEKTWWNFLCCNVMSIF